MFFMTFYVRLIGNELSIPDGRSANKPDWLKELEQCGPAKKAEECLAIAESKRHTLRGGELVGMEQTALRVCHAIGFNAPTKQG